MECVQEKEGLVWESKKEENGREGGRSGALWEKKERGSSGERETRQVYRREKGRKDREKYKRPERGGFSIATFTIEYKPFEESGPPLLLSAGLFCYLSLPEGRILKEKGQKNVFRVSCCEESDSEANKKGGTPKRQWYQIILGGSVSEASQGRIYTRKCA